MKETVSLVKPLALVAMGTLIILMIPLIAMQFTPEVDWNATDFIIMGALLFITGMSYVMVTRYMPGFVGRLAWAGLIGTTFLMIYVNAAVGLIGSGPHAGNLMYTGVIAVVVVGAFLAKNSPRGMEITAFAAVGTILLIAIVQYFLGADSFAQGSLTDIVLVNGFFAMAYTVTGLLFKRADG